MVQRCIVRWGLRVVACLRRDRLLAAAALHDSCVGEGDGWTRSCLSLLLLHGRHDFHIIQYTITRSRYTRIEQKIRISQRFLSFLPI
jgi:hypothetical protein